MQLIRCTKKLQKEMGLKKSDISENEPRESYLGSWHANLIYIDGKKCILFVNDKTLFNFIVPHISREQIRELSSIFKVNLKCVLDTEDIPERTKTKIMSEYESIQYANTNSKSVLGSMNDLAFHYKYHIQSEGGVHSYAVPSIIKKLNHMPMGALEYVFSIEALKSVYDTS
ncbi:MAG: hypothetical protein IID16_07215 [Candidatus Marinimicrobia bacterium]|nr:hypothetical protein [Candidatus Neomarinimicrobiota bacterium]